MVLVGLVAGAVGVLGYFKVRERESCEDVDSLADKITDQLDELEARIDPPKKVQLNISA